MATVVEIIHKTMTALKICLLNNLVRCHNGAVIEAQRSQAIKRYNNELDIVAKNPINSQTSVRVCRYSLLKILMGWIVLDVTRMKNKIVLGKA